MANDKSLADVNRLIELHWQIIAALEKVRGLMLGEAGETPAAPKALAAPKPMLAAQREKAPKRERPAPEPVLADFEQEVDGVRFACTEQQHAFIDMLGASDYVTGAQVFPLHDNSKHRFQCSLKDLKARMAAAGVQAVINSYVRLGYRLEKIEAGGP